MSVSDYAIDIRLILVIFRQVPPRELTRHTVVLPLALPVRGERGRLLAGPIAAAPYAGGCSS
jgi:hypothetical protein